MIIDIKLVPCSRTLWEQFMDFHYQKLPLHPPSRCHLAILEVDGKPVPIGFCASLPYPSGTVKNAFRAHKTVVRMPMSPGMLKIWAAVSDAQAQLHVNEGKRFYSQAPIEYAAYRDNPNSHWARTSSDSRCRKQKGCRSHEYRKLVNVEP